MNNKIGVWGLGVVGKSVLKHLSKHNYSIQITDKREPSAEEARFLQEHAITFVPYSQITEFLENNVSIVPSPGVDINAYCEFAHKWVAELDLFFASWHKPTIAVTGTLGKTSVVHLFTQILEQYTIKTATGGNIGLGMLDLVPQQKQYDYALLELSSFQLEHSTKFAPDIAVWTNFYPNHLDRHGSLEAYFKAKYQIIARQKPHQKALLNWELSSALRTHNECAQRELSFFCTTYITEQLAVGPLDTLYGFDKNNSIIKRTAYSQQTLLHADQLPALSYKANWIIIVALCDMLSLPLEQLTHLTHLDIPHHRLAYVDTINSISFYNDSKSTIPQATLAAVEQLKEKSIYLLLGGVSKGVDRKPFIAQLRTKVVKIICFGAEAQELYNECLLHTIPASAHATLDDAFYASVTQATPGTCIVLSPAGASFDLFKNYQERGSYFEQLVSTYKNQLYNKTV